MRRAATIIAAINVALFIANAAWCRAADQPTDVTSDNELTEGWKQEVNVPESKSGSTKAATLKLWVEQNWLVVRREKPNGYWDWQIVLARVADKNPPQVLLEDRGAIEIKYGQYFIREALGRMRILREKKTADAPPWPAIPLPLGATKVGTQTKTNLPGFIGSKWKVGDWQFWATGFANDRNDIWIRVNHPALTTSSAVTISRGEPMLLDAFGEFPLQDEGDLFIGQRTLADDDDVAEHLRIVKVRAEQKTNPAPELDVAQWFNAPAEKSLEKLRGNVVLLYFWDRASRATPSPVDVATTLIKAFNDRKFITIGIHPAYSSVGLEDQLKQWHVEVPIAVDNGETAKRYTVRTPRAYYLIGKDGKIAWTGTVRAPTEKQIEDLLK
jgi:hypothetical protein